MADDNEILRLGIQADFSALESASRSLRQYIQNTTDAVKAVGDFNAVELQMASSAGITGEAIRDSFGNTSTERLKALTAGTDEWKGSLESVRQSIDAIKSDIEDPSLQEAVDGLGDAGDGGGGLGGRLGRAGSKLRGLPSTQIPGLGIGTDAIGNILRLGSVIDDMSKVSLGAAGGIAAASAALLILTHNAAEAKKAALEELDARTKALELIKNGTTEEINDRIKALQAQRDTNIAIARDAQDTLLNLRVGIRDTFGEAGATLAEINATLGTGAPELAAAKENADKATKALQATDEELVILQQRAGQGAATAADLAAATEAAAKAQEEYTQKLYEFAQDAIDSQIDTQEKIADLIKSGSEQQLNDLIASTQKQVDATKLKIDAEYELAKKYENDPERYRQISEEITKLQAQQTNYQNSLDELSNSMVRAYVVANDAAEKQKEIEADSVASYEKYLNDTQKIEDTWQNARLNAADKYQDKLTSIAEAAVKASEDLLQKLEQKRDDIRTKFEQSETDAETKAQQDALDRQIKFQRTEAQAAEQHQRDIQKIIKDAQEKEQDLILNRDFAGLFNLKRETNKQIEAANENYDQQRQARLEAFQNENEDAQRHFIEAEQERQQNYERQLQQAQIQYQREYAQAAKNRNDALQKAADAYSKELQLASEKHQKELQLRQQSEVAELQLIQQGNAQKLQLEQQYYQQSIALLNAATARAGQEVLGGSHASLDTPQTSAGRGGISSSTHNYGNSIGTVNYSPAIKGNDDQRIAEIAGNVLGKMLEDFLN